MKSEEILKKIESTKEKMRNTDLNNEYYELQFELDMLECKLNEALKHESIEKQKKYKIEIYPDIKLKDRENNEIFLSNWSIYEYDENNDKWKDEPTYFGWEDTPEIAYKEAYSKYNVFLKHN